MIITIMEKELMIWFVWYLSLYLLIMTLMLGGLTLDLQDMCQKGKEHFLELKQVKGNNHLVYMSNNTFL